MKNKLSTIVSVFLLSGSLYAKDINIVNGWQMKGSDSGFSSMDTFNKSCIETIWSYDTVNKRWKAYSPNEIKQNIINNTPTIMSLSSLNENDGFWVNANSDCVIDGNITNTTTLENGLVAHYEFEGNAKDSSGNGNDGTEYGGVSYVDGVIGKAANFEGIMSEYIKVTNSESLSPKNQLSISVWVKVNSFVFSINPIVTKGYSKEDYTLWVSKTGISLLLNWNTSKEFWGKDESENIIANQWVYLTSTFDGTTINYYINGTKTFASVFNYTIDNNQEDLYIGSSYPGGDEYFKGKLDDLRIYNRALSESEIKELYNLRK